MKKKIFIFILLLLIAVPLIFLCSCGDEELDDGQLSVTLNSSGKKLKITVVPDSKVLNDYEKEDIYLFALAPGESFEDVFERDKPVAKKNADEKVKFKLPLVNKKSGLSMLYCGFAAAFYDEDSETYVAATSVAYVKNPHVLSENKEKFPEARSIKGINAEYDTDAVALGASHVIIDIPVEKYVLAAGNSYSLESTVGRNTVFIDGDAVRTLDGRIEYYNENGVIVYLRFTLKTSEEELPEGLKYLAYAGTLKGERYYPLNMNDKVCATAVAGLADCLAERYAAEDGSYGSVAAFIAGEGLNSPGDGVGSASSEEYFEGASLLVRTLYTALASRYENGRVFVSIDHRWKTSGDGSADMSGHKFLTEFAKAVQAAGDYPWNIAIAAQATSADPDRIWYDNSGDGDYLTPSNLNAVCDDFLDSSKYYFDGEERRIIVSDFEIETTDNANTEANQAASYAYAYYKAVDTEKIEAFIYSLQADTEASAAGLRERTSEGVPGREREIYSIVKNINADTEINEYVDDVIGSDSDWEELYEKNSEKVLNAVLCDGRGKVEGGELEELIEDYKASTLFGFTDGSSNGFTAAGNGSYAGLTDGGLKISCANPSAAEIGYIYKTGISKSDLRDDNLLIKLGEIPENCSVTLILVQKNGNKSDVIYESTAYDVHAGESVLLDFDISSFRKELKKGDVEMRILAVGDENLPAAVTVAEILTGKEKSNTFLIVLLIVLASTAFVAIIFLGVVWFRKHYRIEFNSSKKKAKKVKKEKLRDEDDVDEDLYE